MAEEDAIGEPVGAWSEPTLAIGKHSIATSDHSIAIGKSSTTNGIYTTGSGSTSWGIPITPPDPIPEHPEYVGKDGKIYEAEQVVADKDEMERVAKWVGALVFPGTGIRVPTHEGVQAVFVGDWVLKNEQGIVELYDNTDFANDFKRRA